MTWLERLLLYAALLVAGFAIRSEEVGMLKREVSELRKEVLRAQIEVRLLKEPPKVGQKGRR